jgi:hypothetical protein
MNCRNVTLGSMAIIALLGTAGCGSGGNSNETRETIGSGKVYPTYRYRLTVEVDTPEGLKTGSSVIEVATRVAGKMAIPSPGAVSHRVRGEAVAVDLGNAGTLFALLRSDADSEWASRVLFLLARTVPYDEVKALGDDAMFDLRFKDMMSLQAVHVLPRHFRDLPPTGKVKTAPTAYPMLVRFGDITDPKTVAKVDPDNLAVSFGKGIALKRITLERTEDSVTTGIEKRLGWMPTQKGMLDNSGDRNALHSEPERNLTQRAFIQGDDR